MILLDEQMNYEYVVHEMVDGEAEQLTNFLANIPLGMKIHCDCQSAVATEE